MPLAVALALMAVCVVIHAVALALLFKWFSSRRLPERTHYLGAAWLLVEVACWTVLAHLVEMSVWAVAFVGLGALPDFAEALYFSMVTYTTVGYGDIVLPLRWHVLAGIEGLTGILMAGWSTGALFAVVSRLMLRLELSRGNPDRTAT